MYSNYNVTFNFEDDDVTGFPFEMRLNVVAEDNDHAAVVAYRKLLNNNPSLQHMKVARVHTSWDES